MNFSASIRFFDPYFRKSWHVAMLAGVFMLLLCIQAQFKPLGDFGNYWYGSKLLTQGSFDLGVYDPFTFNERVAGAGEQQVFLNYTPIPPATALAYTPFVIFQPHVAKLIWNILTSVLFVWSLFRLFRFYRISFRWILLALPVFYFPIKSNIDQGQTYTLLFFLLAEGWMAYEREKFIPAVLFWTPGILLKIFPAFVLIYIFIRRDFKTAVLLLGAVLSIAGLSMIFIAPEIWQYYCSEIVMRISDGAINDPYAHSYQSIQVLLKNIFLPDDLLNPDAPFNSSSAYLVIYAFMRGALVFLLTTHLINRHTHLDKLFVIILAALLLTGYGSTYSLIFLMIIFPTLISRGIFSRWNLMQLLLVVLACSIPVHWLSSAPLTWAFPRLFLLLFLFLVLTLNTNRIFPRAAWLMGLLVVAFTFFTSLHLVQSQPGKWVSNEQPLLNGKMDALHDFKLGTVSLQTLARDVTGETTQVYYTSIFHSDTLALKFSRHEISVAGRTFSFPKEQIAAAYAGYEQDQLAIYYLSDWSRGPGFYALRVMRVPLRWRSK
ncbi:MAG: glycosyltransferase family 87 protein [Bacteroidia bacterium]